MLRVLRQALALVLTAASAVTLALGIACFLPSFDAALWTKPETGGYFGLQTGNRCVLILYAREIKECAKTTSKRFGDRYYFSYKYRTRSLTFAAVNYVRAPSGLGFGTAIQKGNPTESLRCHAETEIGCRGSVLLFTTPMLLGFPIFSMSRGPVRRWRRRRRGLCIRCGYDLTANSTGVCPECGTHVVAVAKTKPPA